eukprot:gene3628-3675_t
MNQRPHRPHASRGLILSLLALCLPQALCAQPVTDCPLRDAPFLLGSPLIDVMLSAPARVALDRAAPGVVAKLPPFFTGTAAPGFGVILTLRDALAFVGADAALLPAADAALAGVPVTADDRVARCARYDNNRPRFSLKAGKPAVLLFEKITGFRDAPGVDAAHALIGRIARARGWQVVTTDHAGVMNPHDLSRFRVVVWNNISGDVLTLAQRRAFRRYMENGGGFLGMHGTSGDPASFWPWFVQDLIGARFAGHPMTPQFQDARVVVDDPRAPMARGLPAAWTLKDEWYSFVASPRGPGTHVVLTLDETSYDPGTGFGRNLRMGDHPIAWTRGIGRGRMAYSAIGHRPDVYADPNHMRLIENALAWTMKLPR